MKIYMKAYLAQNLGDDLFVKILVDRYKLHKFYAISNGYKSYKKYFSNLKVYSNSYLYRLIRKFKLEKFLANRCKLVVTIGGSMFMEESELDKKREFLLGKNKQFILGSNFGPYKTQEYFDIVKKAFSKAEDVCFREEYSYNIFKDLPNVRVAPDIVFSMDTSNVKITNRNRAIISVISCDYKFNGKYVEEYEEKIIELIKFLQEKEYEICLMSFCKKEKDEEAIEKILKKCPVNLKEKIQTYYYRGNVEEALNIIGDSKLVIGSRFHANIIGMVLGKAIIPILYSDKTKHVIEDMGVDVKMMDIRDMDKFNIKEITEEDLNNVIDVTKQKEESKLQFEKLDMFL